MLEFAIVGFGSRGQLFADLIKNDDGAVLAAVAEPVEEGRKTAAEKFGVAKSRIYKSADDFFAQGKICDAVFICSQDKQHCDMALKAIGLGYDICLEKPAAATEADCIAIRDAANKKGVKVMLTHVLRYAPFYGCLKKIIADGKIGDVVTVNQTENVAYWHFALSYVRGPWRNVADSTPSVTA